MLMVLPWKGVVRFGKRGKLNPRYVGPFKELEKVGSIAYNLKLPQELSKVLNTFHVSNLKKCYTDEPLAVSLDGLHFDDKLDFVEEPIEIMDREFKRLKRSRILIVKVRWNSRRGLKFTWEHEDQFCKKYPHLFTETTPDDENPTSANIKQALRHGSQYYKLEICQEDSSKLNLPDHRSVSQNQRLIQLKTVEWQSHIRPQPLLLTGLIADYYRVGGRGRVLLCACVEIICAVRLSSSVVCNLLLRMSTLVFVDPEISTQSDGAQSSRVPVSLPEDPYDAIRQAYLVGTDAESDPFEDLIEIETPESPHTVAPPICHVGGQRVLACPVRDTRYRIPPITKMAAMPDLAFRKRFRSSYGSLPSPTFPVRKRYRGTSELILDTDSEGDKLREEEDEKGIAVGDEGPSMEVESLGLGGDEVVSEGQQRAAPIVETAVGLRLGYKALRRREIALREGQMPSVFVVVQSSRFVPEPERPERVSALRQPTLTTWIDPEDGITYIDVPAYPPPTPLVQTPPSLEDIKELFTRSRAVRDEIFSQRYRFRSLEHKHERTVMTFRALWRPVLALEAWAGRVDTRMVDMSRAEYDDHRLVHDMLLQQAVLQRELQEIRARVTSLEQERGRKEW
nr:putative reverse transcriptase domain-containing protein [Tanacetum cinerariifolium]